MPGFTDRDLLRRLRAERKQAQAPAVAAAEPAAESPAATAVAPAADLQAEQTNPLEVALVPRLVEIAELAPLRVLEDPQGVWAAGNGATLWDCALFLAAFLAQRPAERGVAGGRVLELGSGLGLLSLVLARLGAEVVATERPIALPLLRRNAAENGLLLEEGAPSSGGRIRVEELSWGSRLPSWSDAGFAAVVASDVVFPNNVDDACGPLVETLCATVLPGVQCWLAYEPRAEAKGPATDKAFLEALAPHFNVRRVLDAELPLDAPEDLWILGLTRREDKATAER